MDQSVRGPEKTEKKEKEKEKEENNCGKLLTCRLRRARQKKYQCCDDSLWGIEVPEVAPRFGPDQGIS